MSRNESKLFDELRELSRITSKFGPKSQPEILGNFRSRSGKQLTKLYDRLIDHPDLSEVSLTNQLEDNKLDVKPESLSRLKLRLKQALLNSLWFLELKSQNYSEYSVKLYEVRRYLFVVSVLKNLSSRRLATSVAQKGLIAAREIEDWYSAIEFLGLLRSTTSQGGDKRAFEEYHREFKYCLQMFVAQKDAELSVERMQLLFATSRSEKPEAASVIIAAVEELDKVTRTHPSFHLKFTALRLKMTGVLIRMDYRSAQIICQEAFQLLERYPLFANNARRAEFSIQLLISSLQLRDSRTAIRAIDLCQQNLSAGDNNWFTFNECHFLYHMRSLNFERANGVLNEVLTLAILNST
jgi:hypothetical protein